VLTVTEMSQEEVERALSTDALDVGLAFSDVLAQDVEWLPLHREWLSLIVGQEHRRHWESGNGHGSVGRGVARPAWARLLRRE